MHHGFQPGQLLLDKYRVERVLGAGGMGVVIAARHLALDELVAIKFMLGTATPADVGRFVREARAAVRLRSQHVARVLDVAALDDGTPYMVLEHLDGHDLARQLRDHGPLPVAEAVDDILQACDAIAEAHTQGIIHRDLKPANLFYTRAADGSPCVKVLDFGIAKWTNAGTERLDPSQPMGSAPYMAPEQFAAPQKVDARTDVWALGATLFHLLTGKTPFHHEDVSTIHSMMHAVLYRHPMRPRALRPELPEQLEAVLLTCLEKEQTKRFESVAALTTALTPFGSELAAIYSRRVARVLGVPEPGTLGPASRPDAAAVSAPDTFPLLPPSSPHPETQPLPLPPVAGPVLLPQLRAPSTKRARLLIATSIGAAACIAAVLIALSARTDREPPSTPETTPVARSLETPSPTPTTGDAPAALQMAVTDAPARIESTAVPSPPRSVKPPPRRAGSTPTSTPSATSAPKEDLYGRRR